MTEILKAELIAFGVLAVLFLWRIAALLGEINKRVTVIELNTRKG
jgi:hypothetical protein